MSGQGTGTGPTRWRTLLLAGCGCLVVVALAIGAVVAMNWSTLSKAAKGAAEALAELHGVQAALLAKYGPAQVFVNTKRHSAISGPILSVRIVNSPAFADLSGEAARLKALEIATVSRAALKNRDYYQHFEVILGKQVNVGVSLSNNEVFMFELSELPGAGTDER